MTSTANRHTLSALAAIALVSVLASGPAFAEEPQQTIHDKTLKSSQGVVSRSSGSKQRKRCPTFSAVAAASLRLATC
jgi:hypothetical protein